MGWDLVALVYVSYLAAVALARREFARARWPLLVATAGAWVSRVAVAVAGGSAASLPTALHVALPALVLLVGYWLSGLLFVRPDVWTERRLQAIDDVVLIRSGVLAWFRRAPRGVTEYFELSYLLVYFMIPAGAAMLALGGHRDRIAGYWTIVLLAEFACYGMLPWIQTRPPRAIEAASTGTPPSHLMRRLNLGVARRASIQVNTVPSGHAAGAAAAALAVGSTMPAAGAGLMVLAISIAAASVLGRYHYLVDAVLGVAVALAVWLVV
jgi:hypothetical protein